jgi:hypothetical protein
LTLLDAAAARGFKVAIHFETQSPYMRSRAEMIEGLRYAVTTLATHPAYFRHNGKPVIFFWRNDAIAPAEWPAIRAKADPDHSTWWIAEGVSTAWLNEFDGLHVYNISWSHDFRSSAAKFAVPTRQRGKLWFGTAMPGWDDTHVHGRAGAFARTRAYGQMFRESFEGAASSQPDAMLITSFNEWMEGTQIEPSVNTGEQYLSQARELISHYHAGEYLPTLTPIAIHRHVGAHSHAHRHAGS